MSLSSHIEEEVLEAYSLGRIADREAAGLEEHLLLCSACQERLEQTDDFVRAFRVAVHGLAPTTEYKRPSAAGRVWNWLAAGLSPAPMAAVVAVTAMAVVALAPRPADSQAAPAAIRLQALRGNGVSLSHEYPANRRLQLELDTKALSGDAYRVEVSDSQGQRLWQSQASVPVQDGLIRVSVTRTMPSGLCWVRLYDPQSGQLAREFGFRTR